ncbi:MAG: alpha/beta fold hydrolase [Solirubrobacterales bacterium]|nr:alpha/beta fold hydrolase [Solirubrobacterales bacterium]
MTEERGGHEAGALARLTLEELGLATGGIGGVHRAIASRVFRYVGPQSTPARMVHDAVSGAVYGGLHGGARAAGAAADLALRHRELVPLSTTRRGAAVLAALQGLRGDALEAQGSPLAQPMAVRVDGAVVEPTPDALAAAFPDASGRLVVFLHGLMETEHSWGLGSREPYGARLARDLGCTPVYVRFNSGRHISENGRSLAELLDALVAAWPVEVGEIALVGHSMGGLVARSAAHQAQAEGLAWVENVRHVVSLGSPHLGAPLEQAVHYASAALHKLPETRPFGGFLRRRSSGIRDLRQGSLVDDDWRDRDPDALRAEACQEVPLLEGATHCFVSATVTRSPRHPVGRVVGDLLVLEGSATGRSRRRTIPFEAEHGHHLGGVNHFTLLNHPEVYDKLRGWLATPPRALTH